MPKFSFTLNTSDLARLSRLSRLSDEGEVERQTAKAMADTLKVLVQQTFVSGRTPWGSPWKPPKGRPGGKPLLDTGALLASINHSAMGPVAEVGARTNLVYAWTHQFGMSITVSGKSG